MGKTPEEMGGEWLTKLVIKVTNDPLFRLAGAIESGIPDLAERHDFYLGQGALGEK